MLLASGMLFSLDVNYTKELHVSHRAGLCGQCGWQGNWMDEDPTPARHTGINKPLMICEALNVVSCAQNICKPLYVWFIH